MNQSDLNSIAEQVSGIQSQILSLANTSYAGQYIFGGTATGTAPYVADASNPTQIDYVGNSAAEPGADRNRSLGRRQPARQQHLFPVRSQCL